MMVDFRSIEVINKDPLVLRDENLLIEPYIDHARQSWKLRVARIDKVPPTQIEMSRAEEDFLFFYSAPAGSC